MYIVTSYILPIGRRGNYYRRHTSATAFRLLRNTDYCYAIPAGDQRYYVTIVSRDRVKPRPPMITRQ